MQCHRARPAVFFQNVPAVSVLGPDAQPVYAKKIPDTRYSQFAHGSDELRRLYQAVGVWVILAFIMQLLLYYIVIGPGKPRALLWT